MNTKRPPLLSDDDIMQSDSRSPAYEVRDHYEAARAKDRELIQMAVDYMHKYVEGWVEEHWKEVMCKEENAFLEKAAAQGFKPSEQ